MGLRLVLSNWSCIDFYSQTELDLESHSCIVSKQKSLLFLCARGYRCRATDVWHSSNNYFANAILFHYSISTNWEGGYVLCCKTKINTPRMYEVPDKGTMKSEILHHLPVAKRGYDSKRWLGGSYSMRSPHKQKTTWQRPITSAFAWCCPRCP